MNCNIVRGSWQQFKGTVTVLWGQATGDPPRVMTGRHLQMVGGLDAACGQAKDEVGRQIDGVHRRSRARSGSKMHSSRQRGGSIFNNITLRLVWQSKPR